MAKAIVVYTTRTNNTKVIADLIAEGLRFAGIEVKTANINELEKQNIELGSFDAVVMGAPTYHGEMAQQMKTFLFSAEKAGLQGKVGGAFGAFGWSGEAPDRIYDTMKNVFGMDMVRGPLRLKNASLGGGIKMAQEYGKEIASKLGA